MSEHFTRNRQRQFLVDLLDRHLGKEGALPDGLPAFQQRAVAACQRAISRFGGVVLADEVGLGKSYVARELTEDFVRPLLVAPAALLPQWAEIAPDLEAVSYATLGRGRRFDEVPDLVICDEAHHLSNPLTQRYRAVAELTANAAVVLATATPFGTDLDGLAAMVRLFAPTGSLVPWLGETLEQLLEEVAAGTMSAVPLCRTILVRRSRSAVKRLHPRGVVVDGGGEPLVLTFPTVVEHTLTREDHDVVAEIAGLIGQLDDRVFDLPLGLMRAQLLYRLSSSAAALDGTLSRMQGWLYRRREALVAGRDLDRSSWRSLFGGLSAEEDRQGLFPFMFSAECGDHAVTPAQVDQQLQLTETMRKHAESLEADARDLHMLLDNLGSTRGELPALVFTQWVETAQSLVRRLMALRPDLGVGLICGSGARLGDRSATIGEVLAALDPCRRRNRRVDVLFATDVLAEGFNLQACRTVVSWDQTWTPRLQIQRFGRIDRLGPGPRRISTVTITPAPRVDQALQLSLRLARRYAEVARSMVGVAVPSWLERSDAREGTHDTSIDHEDDLLILRAEARAALCAPSGGSPPPGYVLRATPRLMPACLFAFDPGIGDRSQVWWFAVSPDGDLIEPELARRLRRLLHGAAEPVDRPPPRALRVATAAACQRRLRARAAMVRPPALPPASTAARLLRRLLEDETLCEVDADFIAARLAGPIPPHTESAAQEVLAGERSWSELQLPTPRPVVVNELRLLGFIDFRDRRLP